MKVIKETPESNMLPVITDVGFGRTVGVAPSAAVQSGITFQDAVENFPYPMAQLMGNRFVHFGPLPPGLSRSAPANTLASGIRSGNWF